MVAGLGGVNPDPGPRFSRSGSNQIYAFRNFSFNLKVNIIEILILYIFDENVERIHSI